jgi:FkbM family methyltransferase
MVSRLFNIARRHWVDRAHYRRARDWAMSIYNRMLIHFRALPLPGRRRRWTITPAGLDHPLHLRLGSSDWYVMEEVFFLDEYGPLEARHPTGMRTVVDLGSNVGMSIRLWQKWWPGVKIAAVEPDTDNVRMARENTKDIGGDVQLYQACVAGRARTVHLDRSRDEYSFRMQEGESVLEAIDAITVPMILERANVSGPIDLLKCDVEGAEAEIFGDCAAWIGRVRYLAVEVHAPYTPDALLADLQRANVTPAWQQTVSKGDVAVVFVQCDNAAPDNMRT